MSTYRLKDVWAVLHNRTERIVSIFIQAEREYLSSTEISVLTREATNDPRLPLWATRQLTGVENGLRAMLYRQALVFAYKINGRYLPIDCPKYKAIAPQDVHDKYSQTGVHVYRCNTEKVYFAA